MLYAWLSGVSFLIVNQVNCNFHFIVKTIAKVKTAKLIKCTSTVLSVNRRVSDKGNELVFYWDTMCISEYRKVNTSDIYQLKSQKLRSKCNEFLC